MRPLPWLHMEPHRIMGPAGSGDGAFDFPHPPTAVTLRCVVSHECAGWEHVSITVRKRARTPNWGEMEFACRKFWTEEEAVMQLHPPRSDWINNVPHVLHLWRPVDGAIPLPPSWLVGLPALNNVDAKPGSPEWKALAVAEREKLITRLEAGGILPPA